MKKRTKRSWNNHSKKKEPRPFSLHDERQIGDIVVGRSVGGGTRKSSRARSLFLTTSTSRVAFSS